MSGDKGITYWDFESTRERTCSKPRRPPAKGKSASTVCVPNKGAGDPVLTQALEHGRWGPHTWALGDCCTLGRCPSTHTPHTTPPAHTLGQHIGNEEGHPPTQGPHQQSMSRETGAGRWEEVGVDARGHCDARAGTREHPVTNHATHCEVGREHKAPGH